MSVNALLASPAAQAYSDGRFADAFRGFEELEARYPDDTTIKRLKGMSLFNLERFWQASQAFRAAAALDPNDAAAQFWLGAALIKTGAVADSYATFQRAAALAPQSPYGKQSALFIAAIDKNVNSRSLFSVDFTAGVQYDDNVSLSRDNPIGAFRFFEQINGRYYLVRRPGWYVSILGGGFFSQNISGGTDEFGNRANNFDLANGAAGFEIRHETSFFGIPVAPGLNYTYNIVGEDYDHFSDVHTLTASLEANPAPNQVIRVYNRFSWDFFVRDGFDSSIFSRDGTRDAAGIEKYIYFSDNRHFVWAGYEYAWTWAEGVNFDARAQKWSGGVSFSLTKDLIASGTAQYVVTRYINYAGAPRRRSEAQTYGAELVRKFGDNLAVKLGYSYTFDESNYAAFETVRNIATLSVTRSF